MPSSDSTDAGPALIAAGNFRARRTDTGIVLEFPALRAPGVALSLGAFSMVCALIPATGLAALLPVENADASTMLAVALVGGLAAPFILASLVFAGLCIYTLMNALTVEISPATIRTERRLFNRLVRVREIACADIAEIQPRISARFQNAFSPTPRYALVAKHRDNREHNIVIAEDLIGQTVMTELHTLICGATGVR